VQYYRVYLNSSVSYTPKYIRILGIFNTTPTCTTNVFVDQGCQHIPSYKSMDEQYIAIGDFDSYHDHVTEYITSYILPTDKNLSDFGAALDWIADRQGNLNEVFIVEIWEELGSRLDHFHINTQEIQSFCSKHPQVVVHRILQQQIWTSRSIQLMLPVDTQWISVWSIHDIPFEINIQGDVLYKGVYILQRPSHGLSNKCLNNTTKQEIFYTTTIKKDRLYCIHAA
jgi:Thiamin pyrophosphokinase, catalytic domain